LDRADVDVPSQLILGGASISWDFNRGAVSIFDKEEPLGQVTDRFPPKRGKSPEDVPKIADRQP